MRTVVWVFVVGCVERNCLKRKCLKWFVLLFGLYSVKVGGNAVYDVVF